MEPFSGYKDVMLESRTPIAPVPFQVLTQMVRYLHTNQGLSRFSIEWEGAATS